MYFNVKLFCDDNIVRILYKMKHLSKHRLVALKMYLEWGIVNIKYTIKPAVIMLSTGYQRRTINNYK